MRISHLVSSRVTRRICAGALLLTAFPAASDFPAFDALPERADLPDPFIMLDGSKVETPEDWVQKRRPELKALFQHYVYGYAPPAPKLLFEETAPETTILDGKGRLKQVTIAFEGLPPGAPRINLALFLPASAQGPVPVFLAINKCGNYEVLPDPAIHHNPDAWCHEKCPETVEEGRGSKQDFWCVEYLLDRGYAFATFHESDVDPDKHDFEDGVHAAFKNVAAPDHAWGTIAAWSWGLRRCIDYLVTDPDIDANRVCVTGHSRRGKTALLTAALDERVALVVPHQSGTGGMALSRNNDQETVERINRVFPHWFCDAFTWFDHRENRLPVDQHLLVALVAPRALLDTAGLQDAWANYESALKNIRAADPVWKFLGAPGIAGNDMVLGPAPLDPEKTGNLMQFRLDEKHTLNQAYWKGILDFADLQFSR
ncbi:MAG: acetylxylan esterase [Candidatus Hydrogenedentes bacterium]|nr:acetylxylan esterase [Candidatus Hydrogenedentota bacterium]